MHEVIYEEEYQSYVHRNLLTDIDYYTFRARCSNKFYWKYLKGKVLDYGCGLGQNIFLHKEDSLGIEISKFAIEECKKKGIKVQDNIKGIKKETFDGVLCVHTLEHLKNPYDTIKKILNILKIGGRLVIVLPYSKNNKPIKNFRSDIAKHFYSWNFNSINELLNDIGFKIVLNKFNYAYGYSKVYKLRFDTAILLIKILGILRNKKEMIVVAEKR